MFYRLPLLFSASYYIFLLLAQLLLAGADQGEIYSFYYISKLVIENLTPFFFILILSCLFFYQNKLYFYTPGNKQKMVIFSAIFTVAYLIIKFLTLQFVLIVILPKLINASQMYNYYDNDVYTLFYQVASLTAYTWLFIVSAVVFYFMAKYGKNYFQTPLIDSSTQSYQNRLIDETSRLDSNISVVEYRKLYAIIFSAIFCCTANCVLWNIYFNIFSSLSEIRMVIDEYYFILFFYSFVSIMINYWFLYTIGQKFMVRTYSWIPISSLFTASAIILVLFGIAALILSCVMLPFVFGLESIVLFILWFIISYILLYFISRLVLRRYFS